MTTHWYSTLFAGELTSFQPEPGSTVYVQPREGDDTQIHLSDAHDLEEDQLEYLSEMLGVAMDDDPSCTTIWWHYEGCLAVVD